jgi:hypothetical protein
MHPHTKYVLLAVLGLNALHAWANELEEGDPVRNAQRMKDCIAQHIAKHDRSTPAQMRRACVEAITDGTFKDPNISLDGMIKRDPNQQ